MAPLGTWGTLRPFLWALLLPLCLFFSTVVFLRRLLPRRVYRAQSFIISVGNLHSGGSGKTPLVAAIADFFKEKRCAVLLRGYGRHSESSQFLFDRKAEGAFSTWGDEACMIATQTSAEVWVGAERAHVVREIERVGPADCIVLDDGFQHLRLHRDLDIVSVNTDKEWSESFLLPLGELREPLGVLQRASAIVFYSGAGQEKSRVKMRQWQRVLSEVAPHVPRFYARRCLDVPPLRPETPVFAFCGIGHPASFYSDIADRLRIVGTKSFPDHYPFKASDLEKIQQEGRVAGAEVFVTTEKDFVRLSANGRELDRQVIAVKMRVELEPSFWTWLSSQVRS